MSQGLKKGVTLTEPPHPHIGVTVKEPSVETGGNRHSRAPVPRTNAPHAERPQSPTDEELSAANRIFWALRAPADENLIDLAAQAVHFETERLGSVKQAEAGILQCAEAAQAAGSVRTWQFWFEDGGWK